VGFDNTSGEPRRAHRPIIETVAASLNALSPVIGDC
jgi:hypothetical protein